MVELYDKTFRHDLKNFIKYMVFFIYKKIVN